MVTTTMETRKRFVFCYYTFTSWLKFAQPITCPFLPGHLSLRHFLQAATPPLEFGYLPFVPTSFCTDIPLPLFLRQDVLRYILNPKEIKKFSLSNNNTTNKNNNSNSSSHNTNNNKKVDLIQMLIQLIKAIYTKILIHRHELRNKYYSF